MAQPTIASIVRNVQSLLSASWKSVYEEKKEELTQMFEEFGDRAYGVWIQKFMEPVADALNAEGYVVKKGFNRADSLENWGPPEERERCAWYVVKSGDGTPIGTMILQVYHSHTSFRIPRAPRLIAVEATERDQIIAALANASTRVKWNLPEQRLPLPANSRTEDTRWEYATDVAIGDCLHAADDGQLFSWTLDEALSHWGRYGWELVSVVPTGNQVIAFFKRRCPAS